MNIIIDSSNEINVEQVEKLIDLCHEDYYILKILKSNKLLFRRNAYLGGKLVGMVMAWKNEFHPYCTYFRLLTNPSYTREDIEAKLFAELRKGELPFQTTIWETVTHLKEYYESSGVKEIRRTYMPILKVDAVIAQVERVEDCLIKTLKDVLTNQLLKLKLLQFVRKTYEETHLDNPVAKKSLEEWEKLLLDDVLVEGSFIYLDKFEQNIEAYSFLHDSAQPATFELGWCGCVRFEFLQRLLVKQIYYAKECNAHFLQGEFDTTSPFAMFSMKALPFEPCPTWITYQL